MDRFLVPRIGILAVVGLAVLLIGVIVLRSPDTHSNLWDRLRGEYARTEVGLVAAEGQTAVAEPGVGMGNALMSLASVWLEVPQGGAVGSLLYPGRRLYLGAGCAQCHGLEGQGGVVGPPLAGLDPQLVAVFARLGPGGMPAFSAEVLTDGELAEIGAYLKALKPTSPAAALAEKLTPAATPVPTPVATPRPTEAPALPTPGLTPLPTPEVTPTPAPAAPAATPSPTPKPVQAVGDAVRGKSLYDGKCAACHGKGAAGGFAPALTGLDPAAIEKVVRQGKGGMPAFNTSLIPDQELRDILAYIHSLASTSGSSR